jgi:signal transduction histidine kinase
MIHSLAFKWIATLLVTSLVGVVLVGLFAYRTTVNEFDRLRAEQAEAAFIEEAITYYQTNGSWDGLADWLYSQIPSQDEGDPHPPQPCALADENGVVVVGNGPFRIGEQVLVSEVEQGTPIVVNGKQVGTVLVALPPPGPDPREQSYLDRTMQALLIGGIGAGAAAVLVGLLLSQRFLQPLVELTQAITAMKQGDLHQQVQARGHDELADLARTFNQMSAQIHHANQLRKQMTADIAHDLRTPLMVISGYIEALRDGTFQPTAERFDAMSREALLLNRLVEDLRTLSLADAGELKLIYQPVQPCDLLEQVRQSFEHMADEKQVMLQVQADANLPELHIDRERMVQVLANLVSNALHYTPAGGSVTLVARRHLGGVQLAIMDTGSGIPGEKLSDIFERFYRIEESRSQNHGESGLGLAIAKSIVEAHQGTIAAESQVGVGTSMTITLRPTPEMPTS